ncbi:MAG: DEAD/DEAH box helicase, partial [Kiritimatiellae bacterium]|nr:DEAD/DEAH box helicase [Kiritimatiellia bacterium]
LLTSNGLGALLADDMGLGKTVQAIAWMLCVRAAQPPDERRPALVVAPLTLLANWRHELAAFAPGLSVYLHQGGQRHVGSGFLRTARRADVVLTSYSLVVREQGAFAEVAWSLVVLDEAQAIKNARAQASRALCALGVERRLALTGTPIENSVADIWSIEEFLNPRLLGTRASFKERFEKPLAANADCSQGRRLSRALEPIVLRRLKSDPAVAGELGEKHEVREYCALAPSARAEYEAALAEYRTGERRQGDAFALLTRLKLVCDGFDGQEISGGKAERLVDLVETIFANGESVLVFSQYAKVGEAIVRLLESRFPHPVAFLHGALSASARERQVEKFRSARGPAAFVLSIRAGGVGLNLTKATHVVHYDRWWNPAVENQATDRTHRIGQGKAVFVHLFMTEGTVEERVEDILRRKKTLAGLVRDGEAFWQAVSL